MALAGILTDAQIAAGLATCKEPGSFNIKTFSAESGMRGKNKGQLASFFALIDQNRDGSIDKNELRQFLQIFASSARLLTDREVRVFLAAGDTNGDGNIEFDEFISLVTR